jgi:DHA1 family inner membrane transport protein
MVLTELTHLLFNYTGILMKEQKSKMPLALYALAAGAFGIGTSEFVIMGLLLEVSQDLNVSLFLAGMLVSGYALGVVFGAPILTLIGTKLPQKRMLLILMAIFTIGNVICALAPNYNIMLAARLITSLCHGAFFGIGSVVATSLVPKNKQASAIALMFTGLTVANILGVPFGTWLGQAYDWRATFWVISAIGPLAILALVIYVPNNIKRLETNIKAECKSVFQKPVLLALTSTTFSSAAMFAMLTYIAPYITQLSGLPETMISPIMLIFGVGMIIGNIGGGKLADVNLHRSLYIALTGVVISLLLFSVLNHFSAAIIVLTLVFGIFSFAAVPPLQMDVLSRAGSAQTLASAMNIAAFNLGNAIGAGAGGLVVDQHSGLTFLPFIGIAFALISMFFIYINRTRSA